MGQQIKWYRTQVDRADLQALSEKSDLKGALQTLGFLSVYFGFGATACWFSLLESTWFWACIPSAVLCGMTVHFFVNGFHELIHDSVFKTQALNILFLKVYSFLGWHNHHYFWASHTEHHKYTLHPPDDLEVVLPISIKGKDIFLTAFFNLGHVKWMIGFNWRLARGIFQGAWEEQLFPESAPEKRRSLRNWARLVLCGHAALALVAVGLGWWMVPVLQMVAPIFGSGLQFLCNTAQHISLQDKVPDFRFCCRTILLNPVLRFVYWNMNYHTEHHMYPAIPCYNLGKFHRLIRHDLPHCPVGLIQAWREILAIQSRQQRDPQYQHIPTFPESANFKNPDSQDLKRPPKLAALVSLSVSESDSPSKVS